MERKQLSISEKNGFLKQITGFGYGSDVIALVKDDLEYGLSIAEINLYLNNKFDIRQQKVYSKCIREEYGQDVIAVIMNENLDGSRMQVALDFYEKGVALDTIKTVVAKGGTAKHMKKTFEIVFDEMQKLKSVSDEESNDREYVSSLVEKIEHLIKEIQYQEERYDALNKKLKVFESSKKDEEFCNNLVKKLENTESDLNSQQDQLNRANSTIARLREQLDEKKEEISRMQTRIDTLEDKLLEKAEKVTKSKESTSDMKNLVEDKSDVTEEAFSHSVSDVESQLPYVIPVYYQIPVVNSQGKVVQHIPLERTERKSSKNGMVDFLGKLGIMKKSRQDIVKLVASGELIPAQLVQIKTAIEKGLTEGQLMELIHNNVSAEKMKEIIEIAVLENSMEY